jgi:redox-sensitive bicupin YhaK (pirin superfamily)
MLPATTEMKMIELRKAQERGFADHGWLRSYHSFSFADYYDPRYNGFGPLRVINEDRVAPGKGFGTHAHRDMEIITYVLDGSLEHKDSIGTGSVIVPGDVQRMSAGTGVRHSEFNPSADRAVHFLQIWIEPASRGIAPSYEQRRFDAQEKRGRLCLVAAPDARENALTLHQNACVYAGLFDGAERALHRLEPRRRGYVHVALGDIRVNGEPLGAGDAARIIDEPAVEIDSGRTAEVLLFDLP